jgi:hypothetical protein
VRRRISNGVEIEDVVRATVLYYFRLCTREMIIKISQICNWHCLKSERSQNILNDRSSPYNREGLINSLPLKIGKTSGNPEAEL